ncbi:MAG TPA: complex I subunit 5 family protein, partial [Pelomicrobium sp.]|nr:complex I subunit 5 family protein [Pelomicrobium sp.]
MTALMPALALLLPLALAVAALTPARRWIGAALVAAPLPALVLAFAREREAVWSLPAVLTGVGFGADGLGLVFLQLTAVLWLAAGIYAAAVFRGDRALPRFAFFFLLCLAGNVGVALARDVVGFYTCFTLMSFAAYGLVVHDAGAGARRAGLTYIVLVVIGEACLVAGLLFGGALDALGFAQWPAALAAAPQRELILALLFIGLGIKAGAVPLHVWMPGAYAAAPAVAGAVLSGAMSAAGVLGWLRFFPGGETPATGWAAAFVAGGLLAAFYGVVVGVTQRDPKALLAYSSISQMGLMTLTVGLGLAEPSAWPLAAAAAGFYALHHGLAKGALFLGADLVARGGSRAAGWMAMAGLALAALSIAAAPFTAGMAAKALLKDAAYASGFWKDAVQGLLP